MHVLPGAIPSKRELALSKGVLIYQVSRFIGNLPDENIAPFLSSIPTSLLLVLNRRM